MRELHFELLWLAPLNIFKLTYVIVPSGIDGINIESFIDH